MTPEEVGELQQEGIQYYHRYISLFQLNDFTGGDPRYAAESGAVRLS